MFIYPLPHGAILPQSSKTRHKGIHPFGEGLILLHAVYPFGIEWDGEKNVIRALQVLHFPGNDPCQES